MRSCSCHHHRSPLLRVNSLRKSSTLPSHPNHPCCCRADSSRCSSSRRFRTTACRSDSSPRLRNSRSQRDSSAHRPSRGHIRGCRTAPMPSRARRPPLPRARRQESWRPTQENHWSCVHLFCRPLAASLIASQGIWGTAKRAIQVPANTRGREITWLRLSSAHAWFGLGAR